MFFVGTIIGIQFMIASAEDKAKVKEALVPYIIGCVVIFGAFTIWSIVVNIGQDIIPAPTPSGNSGNENSKLPYYMGDDGKYYCSKCGDEWEMRQQGCDECRSR